MPRGCRDQVASLGQRWISWGLCGKAWSKRTKPGDSVAARRFTAGSPGGFDGGLGRYGVMVFLTVVLLIFLWAADSNSWCSCSTRAYKSRMMAKNCQLSRMLDDSGAMVKHRYWFAGQSIEEINNSGNIPNT